MRRIKWVPEMIKQVEKKGVAVSKKKENQVLGKRGNMWESRGSDALVEVCRMERRTSVNGHDHLIVWHYGTEILDILLVDKRIVNWGGHSQTDSRIINNVLDYLGMYHPYLRFARIKDKELEVHDQLPNILTWERIKVWREELVREIKEDIKEGYGAEPEKLEVDICEVSYIEPTHVVDINGHWECMFTASEILGFEDEWDNYKEKGYDEFLSDDDCSRLVWSYVLNDVDQLLRGGFFTSRGEAMKEWENKKSVNL